MVCFPAMRRRSRTVYLIPTDGLKETESLVPLQWV